ncbi:MAG: prolipoprotein diacylglyceryl transferase, partial [Bdellovibrio sp.]
RDFAGLGWPSKIKGFDSDPSVRFEIERGLVALVEQVRAGNALLSEVLKPLLEFRHPVQIYGAMGEGLLMFLLMLWFWRVPRKSGQVGALFLMSYGILRFMIEWFRAPDPEVGLQWLNFTRGQWLSFASAILGGTMLLLWSRSGSLVSSGWGRVHSIKINRRGLV